MTTRVLVRQLQRGIETKYLVWGLYQTGLQIARTYTPTYYPKLHAGIVLRNRPIAFFSVEPRQRGLASDLSDSTILAGADHPAINVSTVLSGLPVDPRLSSTSSALTANRGSFIDEHDRKLKIRYEYDGVKIAHSAIFATYLDAVALAVGHDVDGTGATVTAWNPQRTVNLNVRDNAGLRWGVLTRAVMATWQRLLVREQVKSNPRWEGLTFVIEYDGNLVGDGFLLAHQPSRASESSR